MFLLAKNCFADKRYGMVRCPDGKSTYFSKILAVSFSFFHAV
jgi:hypothetical protein